MSDIIYSGVGDPGQRYTPSTLERIYQKRIHIRFPSSQCQPAVSRMSPIHSILYSSELENARRDTEECQINTGWNISPVALCDPGTYVPFKRWIFVWFSCCSAIFLRGVPVCCTDGTLTMFWNPVGTFICFFFSCNPLLNYCFFLQRFFIEQFYFVSYNLTRIL